MHAEDNAGDRSSLPSWGSVLLWSWDILNKIHALFLNWAGFFCLFPASTTLVLLGLQYKLDRKVKLNP